MSRKKSKSRPAKKLTKEASEKSKSPKKLSKDSETRPTQQLGSHLHEETALLGDLPSSEKLIPLVLAGTKKLPLRLEDVALPQDIIDQDLDHKNLALKAILADRASMTTPTVLGYEAS